MTTQTYVFKQQKIRKIYEVSYTDSSGKRCFINFNRCKKQALNFFNRAKILFGENKGGIFLDIYNEKNTLINYLEHHTIPLDEETRYEIHKRNQNSR